MYNTLRIVTEQNKNTMGKKQIFSKSLQANKDFVNNTPKENA